MKITSRQRLAGAVPLFVAAVLVAAEGNRPQLVSPKVAVPPTIDGKETDEVWEKASPLELSLKDVPGSPRGRAIRAVIKSVHTDTHVYFLLRWQDASQDIFHKMWVWNPQTKEYEQSKDLEDDCAVAFPISGEFTADMLSGIEAVWDAWHWKSARTDPAGHAQDRRHIYGFEPPRPQAKTYEARNGKKIYIDRPEDMGRSTTMSRPKPTEFIATSLYQYSPQLPTESAADIRAKGEWVNAWWTVEMERRLNTGYDDDTQFDLSREYPMAVAVHDAEEYQNHSVSGVIRLRFAER